MSPKPQRYAPLDRAAAVTALDRLVARVAVILDVVGDRFPLFADADGADKWVTTEDGNWCAGYWIALLFLAAKHTGNKALRKRFEKAAYDRIPDMLTQQTDNLFAGLNHHYAGYVGFDLTGDENLKEIGLRGACAMRDLYHSQARQIPIGHYATAPKFTPAFKATMPLDRRFLAAVDAIHTSVPVLFRAHEETGDHGFREVALHHIERHLSWYVRPNASTIQMMAFDPDTAAPAGHYSPLAAGPDGCWSRGFGWHIAGLAVSLKYNEDKLLAVLKQAVEYYLSHVDTTLVPTWDFSLTGEDAPYDASAAAVSAYGLLELSCSPETNSLRSVGANILGSLITGFQSQGSGRSDTGAILHGCYRFPSQVAVDNELIWSDFYVAVALDRLLDRFPV